MKPRLKFRYKKQMANLNCGRILLKTYIQFLENYISQLSKLLCKKLSSIG